MMRKSNLLLFLLLCGLVGYITALELSRSGSLEEEIFNFQELISKGIKTIRIENATGSYTLAATVPPGASGSKEMNWRVAGLPGVPVDQKNLESLLAGLAAIDLRDSYQPDQETIVDLGLSPSKVSLIINSGEEQQLRIEIGKLNKYLGERYAVLTGHSRIFMVSESLYQDAAKARDQYLVGRLFEYHPDQVFWARFGLENQSEILLEKRDQEWEVNGKEGDEVFIRKLLKDLLGLSASAYVQKLESDQQLITVLSIEILILNESNETVRQRVRIYKGKDGQQAWRFYASKEDTTPLYLLSVKDLKKIYPREEVLLKVEAEPLLPQLENPPPDKVPAGQVFS